VIGWVAWRVNSRVILKGEEREVEGWGGGGDADRDRHSRLRHRKGSRKMVLTLEGIVRR
jgi:hypothetical protein